MSVFHNIYKEKYEEILNKHKSESIKTLYTLSNSYKSTVINTFSWFNLPKGTLKKTPETSLLYWGLIAFAKWDNEFVVYPAFPSGALMGNGRYSKYTLIKFNGETRDFNYEDIELCFANSLEVPPIIMVEEMAEKSTFALTSTLNALERSMIPSILNCKDEKTLNKLTDLYSRGKNELPFRLALSDTYGDDTITVTDFFDNRKYDVLSQWDIYIRFRNLFYTTFGINNIEIQKKERLTEAEGSGNDEITRYTFLKDMYDCRIDFIDRVKEKFGYELSIEINRDSTTVYQLTATNDDKIEAIKLDVLRGVNLTGVDNNNEDNEVDKDVEV